MAGRITYKEESIAFNNRQFSSTISSLVEFAQRTVVSNEQEFINKMRKEMIENYYPGLGIDIETDFPKLEERKFWARMFYETAREIFERKIGIQDYFFWQSQRIYQVYGTGYLFEKAVREIEPNWVPDIRDYREYNEWVKRQNSD